ncbi:MAG: 2-C-methyl-D-erythritol 4-phosphate cytidylyltransferase [Nitrospirae bacterium]|nr:2-C-methyl-D-erythritol 4-phosphate cytidylyltransferase [Nitrospirota bacterium]
MPHNAVAIVPSAGLGRRFGEDRNKPFETLGGKPVLIWALETLEKMPEISEIIPVLKETDMQAATELFSHYTISKVKRIAPGGKERQDSVFNGLHFIKDNATVVLIHDGARPFLKAKTVRRALKALSGCDGVVIGVPPKDTIKEIEGGFIRQTLKRDTLIAIQTPQIFFYQPLFDAYAKAMKESFYATDDAALVERNGGRISVVEGEYTNIKITTPEDLVIAEAFLKMMGEEKP